MIRSALMNVMTAAALKAGRGLKRDFGEVENLQVSVKGPESAERYQELATAVDKHCPVLDLFQNPVPVTRVTN